MSSSLRDPLILFLIFQVVLIVLFGTCTEYGPTAAANLPSSTAQSDASYYPMLQDVSVMIWIGFGFLMVFLRKHGFSSVGYNFLISCLCVQWAMLCLGFFHRVFGEHSWSKIELGLTSLINADFAAGSILISFGALVGKMKPTQYLIVALIEIVLYSINESLVYVQFKASDVGGSIVIHAFGAFFGLACSWVATPADLNSRDSENTSSVTSDAFAMIGTLFLWLFWPSFNAALAASGATQTRAVINTYLTLSACCVTAFAWSFIMRGEDQFNMVDIQNATLAGGVAVGAVADMIIQPYSSMILGMVAGTVSVFGYTWLQPRLWDKLKLHDTCGVINLHLIPSLIGAFASVYFAAVAETSDYGKDLLLIFPPRASRSASSQALNQLAALGTTTAIAIVSGALTGLFVRSSLFKQPNQLFNDAESWHVPGSDVIHPFDSNATAVPLKIVTSS